ncbi:MAG: LysM peptidoglycan-binding domain-containing protein [Candidatus Omnitrophica bacterium]|nr:LysM peptidoglycan-binding domain-containing protein [Candidatus Omnitrophota bacterium]
MKRIVLLSISIMLIFALSGCGCVRTYTFQKERLDQNIVSSDNNRGYLMGTPPPVTKTTPSTRTMVGIDVELPMASEIKEKAKKDRLKKRGDIAKPESRKKVGRAFTSDSEISGNRGYVMGSTTDKSSILTENAIPTRATSATSSVAAKFEAGDVKVSTMRKEKVFDTYVVQKGDTLSEISAKSEIYGTSKKWREIFEANRDILKRPEAIRVGQALRIPRNSDEDIK